MRMLQRHQDLTYERACALMGPAYTKALATIASVFDMIPEEGAFEEPRRLGGAHILAVGEQRFRR